MTFEKEDINAIVVADLVRMNHWDNEINFLINDDSFLAQMKRRQDWSMNESAINTNLASMKTRTLGVGTTQKGDPVCMKNTERTRPKGKEHHWMRTNVIKIDMSKNES